MTFTSDERREIARRLRAAAKTKSNSSDYLWQRLEIAVNGWKFGDAVDDSYALNNDVFARLADLIDPTCHKVIPDETEGYVFCSNRRIVGPTTNDADAEVTNGGVHR